MALITGSSTIDWSGVALDPVDIQTDVDNFLIRFDEVLADFDAGHYNFNSPPTSTFLSFTLIPPALNSGGIITVRGSGFNTNDPVVKSFNYSNSSTGDVVSFTGTLDFVGNEVINRISIGSTGFQQTIIGNIVVDPFGNILGGSIAQLQETLGSTEATIKGNLVVDANFNISGTVTQISVLSGTNTIVMSGLSLPYSALDSVTTANDLFSAVGNQMTGNDTITYTNNSGAGMSFYGGPGNDTITISGPNADTLNGGDGNDTLNGGDGNDILDGGTGNDILNGGAGDDTLQGGDGNDVFLIGSAAEHGVGEAIDGGAGSDVIRFTSTTLGQTLVLAPGVTAVESVVIGTAAGVITGLTALNVDASAVGSGLSLTGNNGANILTGTGFGDVLSGNAGNDTLLGGDGNDTLLGGLGQDTVNGGTGDDQITMLVTAGNVDTIDAGDGTDTLLLSGVVPGNHVVVVDLSSLTDQVVSIGGTLDDTRAQINFEHLNVSGIGSSANVTGSAGDNIIIGSNGNDIIDGGAGNDTITGGAGADNLQGGADNDLFLLASVTEFAAGEIINGGADTDTLRYTGNAAATLTLTNLVTNIEQVEIANTAGDPTGIAAINVNAAAVANGLTITGNNGNNVLTGTSQADTLIGNAGNDTLNGGDGNDILDGGTGNDILKGGAGDDTLQGGDGNDVFLIGSAAEHGVGEAIDGGAGSDVIRFTSTSAGQTLVLAPGVTTVESVVIGTAAGVITGLTALNVDASAVGSGLSLTGNNGANILTGTDFGDVLSGNAGNDIIDGGAGNDTLIGGVGADNLQGGTGNDLFLLASTAEFAAGEIIDGGADTDTLRYTGNAAATLTLRRISSPTSSRWRLPIRREIRRGSQRST